MNSGWFPFSCFSFGILVLCILTHSPNVKTQWFTWKEQSHRYCYAYHLCFSNYKSKCLMWKRPVTQLFLASYSKFLMRNPALGCQSSIQTITKYSASVKKKILAIHTVALTKRGGREEEAQRLLSMRASCSTTYTFTKGLQYADIFTKIKFSCVGPWCWDLFGHAVIYIPLDRMDTPAPCRLCKNHFPMEVRSASTDTLTCLGLTPSY